jgi:membrane-associated phospholipid phosphatase
MPGEDLTPPSAELSVFGNLWSGIVDAAGVTDFGDQAIVLPLTVGTAVIFALSGWRRGALAWTATIGGTLGLILLLKLRFLACGHFPPGTGPGNPSGHTAAAAAVYGGLVAIVMRSIWANKRWTVPCTVAIAALVAVVIGASRLILDLHSVAEVVVGGTIGVGGAVSFVVLAGPPLRSVGIMRVVVLALLVIVMLYGFRLPAEAAIKSVATDLWPFSKCM